MKTSPDSAFCLHPSGLQSSALPSILLLAAGGSTRMGTTKQALQHQGISLLRHAAQIALGSTCRPIVVVLGADAKSLRGELLGLEVLSVENPNWSAGMGTSIRAGMDALLQKEKPPAVVILLCDQPRVTSQHLDELVNTWRRTGAGIVASEYDHIAGAPALFDRHHFDSLRALPDAVGARALIKQARADLTTVPFPDAALDIDTPADYQRLQGNG